MKYLSKEPMFFSMYRPSEKRVSVFDDGLEESTRRIERDSPHKFVMGALGMCQKCMLDREGHRKKFA